MFEGISRCISVRRGKSSKAGRKIAHKFGLIVCETREVLRTVNLKRNEVDTLGPFGNLIVDCGQNE